MPVKEFLERARWFIQMTLSYRDFHLLAMILGNSIIYIDLLQKNKEQE